jgi:hypothetical protein
VTQLAVQYELLEASQESVEKSVTHIASILLYAPLIVWKDCCFVQKAWAGGGISISLGFETKVTEH